MLYSKQTSLSYRMNQMLTNVIICFHTKFVGLNYEIIMIFKGKFKCIRKLLHISFIYSLTFVPVLTPLLEDRNKLMREM